METNQTGPETGATPDDVKGDSAPTSGPADGAVGSAPPAAPHETGDGFFGWLRRLDIPRRPGWLGGVSAGVAARLGIDPIIVRGIIVVAAVLGAPFVLLYAVAWLLLPDTEGRIHLERLLRGIVDPAIVGIAVMGVIGLIPLVQGGWLGWRWWPDWPSVWFGGIDVLAPVRVLWTIALIAGVVVLVVWLIRRSSQTSPGGVNGADSRMASASAAPVPGNPPVPSATTDAATGAASVSGEPPVPAMGADAAEIADWRAQHEAWRRSHNEWRQSQQDAERAARARAAMENKVKAQALIAESEEARRIRRAERPRASAAYVFTVLGVALVSATLAAFWALASPDLSGYAIAVAFAVGVIVLAAGMFVAAVSRRRSGFLAFLTALTTVIMLGVAVAPSSSVVPPSYGIPMLESHSVVQPVGDAYFTAYDAVRDAPGTPEVRLTQWVGDVHLTVLDDVRVVLDASEAGRVEVLERSADGSVDVRSDYGDADGIHTLGGEPGQGADARLIVRQQVGTIYVTIDEGAGR
jgi:phage shock protein PspC (stress-responsive transcriptional regulator)